MEEFRPTIAPPGRLTRLGIVLDTRNAPARLREVARMCDRAGIDALWTRDHLAPTEEGPSLESWTALTMAALDTSRVRAGATLNFEFRPPAILAAMAGTLDAALAGRLELALSPGWLEHEHRDFGFDFPDTAARTKQLEEYAGALRSLLKGRTVTSAGAYELHEAELGVASPQPAGPTLSIEAVSPTQIEAAARVADNVVVPAASVRDIRAAVSLIHETCEKQDRDPSTLGIALEVPVSIGRTHAEAQARAETESLFRAVGHPAKVGIFGTMEECQTRVIELAHAGVTDLRCIPPNAPDIPDVIAQLTAIVIGSRDILSPNSPRSKAPDPPKTWGGRAFRPPPEQP